MDNTGQISMIESRNTPVTTKKKGYGWIIIVIVALVLIVGICGVVAVLVSTNQESETGDEEISESEIEVAEMVVDDSKIGQAFWDKNPTKDDCEKLVEYAKEYSEHYGIKYEAIKACESDSLTVGFEEKESDEYPFNDMQIIYLQDESYCHVFPFYEGFVSLDGYKNYSGDCDIETEVILIRSAE